jgi:hypothetical protein
VESVTILRALWRRRIEVCLVAVLAIATGWALAYGMSFPPKSRTYTVGVATTSILVDTPKSQVVEIDPKGSDTLASRANVLVNLMVDGEIKNAIARRVGLSPEQLIASSQAPADAAPATPLTARSYAFMTSVALTSDMAELPIIRVETQAPNVKQAIKLANAAVTGLGDYLDSKAAAETVSDTRRLRVRALGTAQGHDSTRGPGRMMALAAAIFVFLAGCAIILAMSALVRGWRAAVAAEQHVDEHAVTADAIADDDALEQPVWPAQHNQPTKLRAW